MQELNTPISLDLAENNDFIVVYAMQGDRNSRKLAASLTYNGEDFTIPSGVIARLMGHRPDKKPIFEDCVITGNTITCILTDYNLACAGVAPCKIGLYDENTYVDKKNRGQLLSSATFEINIPENPLDENLIIATPEFSALTNALNRISQALIDAENAVGIMKVIQSEWIVLKTDLNKVRTDTITAKDNAIAATNEINKTNTLVTQAEAIRVTSENTRIASENERKSSETARTQAESARNSNENIRISAENTRISQETNRVNAESARAVSESTRVSNEDTRKTNETARKNAETLRLDAETKRNTNENARISKETERLNAENARISAETTRLTDENARKTAESSRISNESARSTAETNRINAETLRANAEKTRSSSETTRLTNETARTSEETKRIQAENSRISLETDRVNSESNRKTNETQRIANESKRQTDTSTALTNSNLATSRANKAADDVETLLDGKGYVTLGETNTTAYRGDRGKIAYDHSQTAHARTDATKTATSTTNGNILINGTESKVYTHPAVHPANIIAQDANNRFVTDVEKSTWNSKADSNHNHNYAGSTSAGGAANTAVKLTNARSIGNANFDGTANLTLAQIGAASLTEVADLKKSVSDGKQKVAAAITAKGQATAQDAAFDVIATNISKIQTGVNLAGTDARPYDVAQGKKFFADNSNSIQSGLLMDWRGNGEHLNVSTYVDNSIGGTVLYNDVGEVIIDNDNAITILGLTPNIVNNGVELKTRGIDTDTYILTGTFTADANAFSTDILSGKTAYIKGNKITGTMQDRGTINQSLAINGSYTIPAGYHNGSGKVTQNIISKNTTTYTPRTYDQTISAGQYLNGAQIIKGDVNLLSSNIRTGVSIFGVTGTAGGIQSGYHSFALEINNKYDGNITLLSLANYTFPAGYSYFQITIEEGMGNTVGGLTGMVGASADTNIVSINNGKIYNFTYNGGTNSDSFKTKLPSYCIVIVHFTFFNARTSEIFSIDSEGIVP